MLLVTHDSFSRKKFLHLVILISIKKIAMYLNENKILRLKTNIQVSKQKSSFLTCNKLKQILNAPYWQRIIRVCVIKYIDQGISFINIYLIFLSSCVRKLQLSLAPLCDVVHVWEKFLISKYIKPTLDNREAGRYLTKDRMAIMWTGSQINDVASLQNLLINQRL